MLNKFLLCELPPSVIDNMLHTKNSTQREWVNFFVNVCFDLCISAFSALLNCWKVQISELRCLSTEKKLFFESSFFRKIYFLCCFSSFLCLFIEDVMKIFLLDSATYGFCNFSWKSLASAKGISSVLLPSLMFFMEKTNCRFLSYVTGCKIMNLPWAQNLNAQRRLGSETDWILRKISFQIQELSC